MSLNISDIKAQGTDPQAGPRDVKINLKDGEVIRATVVGRSPEGGLVLSARGGQLNIPGGPELPVGSRHLLQVSVTGSRIELKIMEGPSANTGTPVNTVPSGTPGGGLINILTELNNALDQVALNRTAGQSLQGLRELLPLIRYQDATEAGAMWVKNNIMAGGMLWEGKVAEFLLSGGKNSPIRDLVKGDLKGILLSLEKGLISEGGADALMTKIRQALSLIEGNQQLNISALDQGLGWLFILPGFKDDGFLGAEILARKRDDKGGVFFSVLLEFTRLGRFQANVSMIESTVSVRILMDDQGKADMVNQALHLLERGLSALNIGNIKVSCDVRKGEETMEELVPGLRGRRHNVSIVV